MGIHRGGNRSNILIVALASCAVAACVTPTNFNDSNDAGAANEASHQGEGGHVGAAGAAGKSSNAATGGSTGGGTGGTTGGTGTGGNGTGGSNVAAQGTGGTGTDGQGTGGKNTGGTSTGGQGTGGNGTGGQATSTGGSGTGGTPSSGGSSGSNNGTGGAGGMAGSTCSTMNLAGACGTTCKPGTYDCTSGTPMCVQKNASAGLTCGNGQVCDGNGSCVSCMMGAACGSACNPGTFDCSTGTPTCKNQKMMSAGSTCGNNQVCDGGGNCVSCTANAMCGTTCKPGTTSCTSGASVCNQTNAPAGTSCNNNQICDGSGNCVAKTGDGGSCQTSAQCQNGNCSKNPNSSASLCCASGFSNCGSCVNEQSDNANCGACGHKCPANQICQNSTCACVGKTLSCGGCGSWAFDSNTTEGWMSGSASGDDQADNGVQNVTISTATKHDGSAALAVPMSIDLNPKFYGEVVVPLCSSGTVNLAGYKMSAWIYFAGPPITFDAPVVGFWAAGSSSSDVTGWAWTVPITVGGWNQYQGQFTMSVDANRVGVSLGPGQDWTGTMYVDSVTVTGP